MKIGMNLMLWTAHPDFAADSQTIDKLSDFGYDAFEMTVGELDGALIAKYAKKAQEKGMTVQALDLFPVTEGDLIGHDPAMRRAAVERLKAGVHKARDLGSPVFSGPFFQGLCNTTQVGPTEEERKWCVEGLRAIGEEAQKCDMLIAAEPLNRFEMHICNTIAQAYDLCSRTELDNVGILADTNHANIEELDVTKSYVSHADRIFNIHLSECNRGIPGSGHGIPRDLCKAMLAAGYKGNFIVEAFNANVPETKPLLRLWAPLADTEDEIAVKGLQYIQDCLQ